MATSLLADSEIQKTAVEFLEAAMRSRRDNVDKCSPLGPSENKIRHIYETFLGGRPWSQSRDGLPTCSWWDANFRQWRQLSMNFWNCFRLWSFRVYILLLLNIRERFHSADQRNWKKKRRESNKPDCTSVSQTPSDQNFRFEITAVWD